MKTDYTMKTNPKIAAYFLATAIWADGEYSRAERSFLHSIAQNIDIETLEEDVAAAASELAPLTSEEVTEKLTSIAQQVASDEKDGLLALCLQVMGCDSYLAAEEVTNFFVLAKILGIDEDRAQVMLAQLANDDEDVIEENE